mgnify:CR=1 FL=1
MEQTAPKKRGRPPKPPQPKPEKVKVAIEMPPLPPPRKRNKKNVAWDQDPEILARLSTVANMMTQGAKSYQIADALSVTIKTIQRDITRVYTLWRRESLQEIDDARAKSIAQYEEIKTRAWEGYRKVSGYVNGANMPNPRLMKEQQNWLKLAMDAESQIADLQGTKITRLSLDGKVEHTLRASDLTDEQLLSFITGNTK